ncbi:PREDICTED: uncharacterized protein LOC109359783 [Lupinus angustifolius]|uniref:uncharacterized protein LOC109359783 n=1 Tax=Lupinus angustifolius TaxID=3871 RepID=UPI00092E794B|nr:PREDICTED: uncharacterized protein LOC109359783 [Lupinus angustifolius]
MDTNFSPIATEARAMRTSLRARRKWGCIDGTIGKPEEESSKMEDWWTVQSMLVSWILNTVEPNLRSTISYMENARDLWDDIKERFSVVNGPRIQQLKSELAGCKQGAVSMVTYYGKMKKQQRWATKLQGFHYEIFYKHGRDNRVVDALSRCESAESILVSLSSPVPTVLTQLAQYYATTEGKQLVEKLLKFST